MDREAATAEGDIHGRHACKTALPRALPLWGVVRGFGVLGRTTPVPGQEVCEAGPSGDADLTVVPPWATEQRNGEVALVPSALRSVPRNRTKSPVGCTRSWPRIRVLPGAAIGQPNRGTKLVFR
jgi:hypothetical protein